jgi:hypothetical protein
MEKENVETHKFQEGDVYFPIEVTPEGGPVIHRSIWDEVSEEIKNPHAFKTLREALNYLHENTDYTVVKYYESRTFKIIDIEI